jgi:cell division protein ZapA (FtsZ GTPase activity inhibitor)
MDKTVRVAVLGRSYPLRVRESDEGFTLRVADLVDERVQSMERQAPGHPELTHAVIAALSLGEELLTALDTLEATRRELESAQAALAEAGLAPAAPADLDHVRADADALADRLEAALGGGDGAARTPLPPISKGSAPSDAASLAHGKTRANLEGPSAVLPSPAAGRDEEAPEGTDSEEAGADSPHPKTP